MCRLHGSLIAEEATSARNATTAAATQYTNKTDHVPFTWALPLPLRALSATIHNQDFREKLSQRPYNTHSYRYLKRWSDNNIEKKKYPSAFIHTYDPQRQPEAQHRRRQQVNKGNECQEFVRYKTGFDYCT